MTIEANTVVSLRYIMRNSRGEVLEDIMNGEPVEYIQGTGRIMPELENELLGLGAGEHRTISFSTGKPEQEFQIEVIIDRLREATPQECATGMPLSGQKKTDCGPGCCC